MRMRRPTQLAVSSRCHADLHCDNLCLSVHVVRAYRSYFACDSGVQTTAVELPALVTCTARTRIRKAPVRAFPKLSRSQMRKPQLVAWRAVRWAVALETPLHDVDPQMPLQLSCICELARAGEEALQMLSIHSAGKTGYHAEELMSSWPRRWRQPMMGQAISDALALDASVSKLSRGQPRQWLHSQHEFDGDLVGLSANLVDHSARRPAVGPPTQGTTRATVTSDSKITALSAEVVQ